VDGRELIRGPNNENDEEDKGGEIDRAASTEAGGTADVDHCDVGEPHREGEEDLGIAEVRGADCGLCDERADEQAGGHARKAEEERLEGDLIGGFEWGKPRQRGEFFLEATLLNEIEQRRDERDDESSVGCEQEGDVEKDPAGVEGGKGGTLLTGTKRGNETEEKGDRKDKDADGDGFVATVNDKKGDGEEKAEEREGLVGVDRETMMGGIEHLRQRDEVEEDGGSGGRDSDVTPAGAVVEGGGQDRERGYAVEEDRDSEPKEGHFIWWLV
jgi:hypothetical protein